MTAGMYTNFIKTSNPSLSPSDANGRGGSGEAATEWPAWRVDEPMLVNLNQSGGRPYSVMTGSGVVVTQFRGEGLRNAFGRHRADLWEGGRGARCQVWREVGALVPM